VSIQEEADFIALRENRSYDIDSKFAHLLARSFYTAALQESLQYGGSFNLAFWCVAGYCD
jgi:hypothetical protein